MYVVPVLEGIPFVGDPYNTTLVRIKLHKAVPFPLLQFIKVFLEKGLILFGADDSVDKRDIDKESCSRKDDLWHVIYCRHGTAKV